MKKRTTVLSMAIALLCVLSSCQPWGSYDNPGDPKAADYQGYPTVASSADIQAASPADGGTLTGLSLTITKVAGATAYQIALATAKDDLAALPSAQDSDSWLSSTTNVFDLSLYPTAIVDSTTYYWRACAKESSGSWGAWSTTASFTTKFPAASTPTFNPPSGTYTTNQSVAISSTTANATIYYTTDSTTPTTGSNKYTGTAITATVSPATTIEAIAVAAGYKQSAVGIATYNKKYSIGDTGPAGGLIFYDKGSYSNGWQYLEAAPSDQSTGIQWYNGSYTTTGATATAIGTGAANTQAIVASQGAGSYAAELCADLTLGGYSDWFLPSEDELNQMYVNLKEQGRGGFASAWYWSSSENIGSLDYAWGQYFGAATRTTTARTTTTMCGRRGLFNHLSI